MSSASRFRTWCCYARPRRWSARGCLSARSEARFASSGSSFPKAVRSAVCRSPRAATRSWSATATRSGSPNPARGCSTSTWRSLRARSRPSPGRLIAEVEELEESLEAEDWFALGCDLEAAAPEQARDAYRRCLELDPYHPEGRVNLGRLLHEARWLRAAEAQYRLTLTLRPDDSIALFNLGVCLEDLDRPQAAMRVYKKAIEVDPKCADAHYNVAGLYEQDGDKAAALRHLKIYRKLTKSRDH